MQNLNGTFFMINYNGNILKSEDNFIYNNRAFLYGDAVFETIKTIKRRVLFLEDHYLRLMASMRILRMEIPMNFTMEFLENQIEMVLKSNNFNDANRVRVTIYRDSEGFYLPDTNKISYIITAKPIESSVYKMENKNYEVDLFKDFYISKNILSTLKTTNKLINITGSIFAKENGFDNCLLLNEEKNIVEALNGNIFMLIDNKLITPAILDGCINGIMRKKILSLVRKNNEIEVLEQSISPFELQKADELFITNVIIGIQPVAKFRKKEFETKLSSNLIEQLNNSI